jgi:hypothetical protein
MPEVVAKLPHIEGIDPGGENGRWITRLLFSDGSRRAYDQIPGDPGSKWWLDGGV